MIRIEEISIKGDRKINFRFSDGIEKLIDFTPFMKEDALSNLLSNPDYFREVKMYENGRGIYWPNGYDFCPDFLYKHQTEKVEV